MAQSSTNNAVDAFTLATESGTDTVTALTVTFTGTDVNDVAASGVKIYEDNGGTPNEWDATDTLIDTASFSGTTASFTGLNISVNTTGTQYLVTYDIAPGATASNTLQGAITAATVTNTLVNNDTIDATLTVILPTTTIGDVHYRWRNDDGAEGAASWATPEDTPLSSVASSSPIRLRVEISNEGTGNDAGPTTYLLEYATSTAGPWTPVEVAGVSTNSHWQMTDSSTWQR